MIRNEAISGSRSSRTIPASTQRSSVWRNSSAMRRISPAKRSRVASGSSFSSPMKMR
jgi:hypothetical protein